MKKITDSIQSAIANVQSAFPSVFTKEDVVSILEGLIDDVTEDEETTTSATLTEEEMEELASNIASSIVGEGVDIISDYELSLNYKEVELDSVDYDSQSIENEAFRAIKDFFEERK